MRLIRIQHIRCNEIDINKFYITHLDDENTTKGVLKAQKQMLDDRELFKQTSVEPPYLHLKSPELEDLTVKEANSRIAERFKEIAIWRAEQAKGTKGFDFYLIKNGIIPLHSVEDEDVLEVEVDWGHHHGETYAYK